MVKLSVFPPVQQWDSAGVMIRVKKGEFSESFFSPLKFGFWFGEEDFFVHVQISVPLYWRIMEREEGGQ